MKILKLQIENFMRLRSVDVTPSQYVNKISGKNAQGKSSLFQAILVLLGGSRYLPDKPIHGDNEEANLFMDLGEYQIKRSIDEKGSKLELYNEIGEKIRKSPQKILDLLIDKLCFDPVEFSRMNNKDQVDTLKKMVGLDFSEIDDKRITIFDNRTQAKKQLEQLKIQFLSKIEHKDTPDSEIIVNDLMEELNKLNKLNNEVSSQTDKLSFLTSKLHDLGKNLQEIQNQMDTLKKEGDQVLNYLDNNKIIDTTTLQEKIKDSQRLNGYLLDKKEKSKLKQRILKGTKIVKTMTDEITLIDNNKKDKLMSVEFPISGLNIEDDYVTFNSLPLSQASSAEIITISASISMALKPGLKVIFIKDGSNLDANSMQAIYDLASKFDFQIWVESVGDESGNDGLYIEDGVVVEDNLIKKTA